MTISKNTYSALLLGTLIASFFSGSADSTETTSDVGVKQPAGKTIMARGKVTATSINDSTERRIRRRSEVFNIDNVKTGTKSRAQFSMIDGGLLSLKPNSEIRISEYEFKDGATNSTASIELIKGGLRSISGKIKKRGGDFDVKTPVGSIGIRGTHFELEMVDGDLAIAVWDGAIDLTVDSGGQAQTVSFGEGEDFSFGVVSSQGEVTQLLQPPSNFQQGHSSEGDDDSEESDSSDDSDQEGSDDEGSNQENDKDSDATEIDSEEDDNQQNTDDETNNDDNSSSVSEQTGQGDTSSTENTVPVSNLDSEQSDVGDLTSESVETGDLESISVEVDETNLYTEQTLITESENDLAEIISRRQGQFTYDSLRSSELESTRGGVSNFQMSMTVDFDNGTVPQGQLSATDNGGEWFATFSGFINLTALDLDITFAAYGNERADGTIEAVFFDSADAILGSFELFEIKQPSNKFSGSFILD